MAIELKVEQIIKDAKFYLNGSRGKRLLRIIPEDGFNICENHHPLEICLRKAGIGAYYFSGDKVGKDGDYEIDLRKMRVIY